MSADEQTKSNGNQPFHFVNPWLQKMFDLGLLSKEHHQCSKTSWHNPFTLVGDSNFEFQTNGQLAFQKEIIDHFVSLLFNMSKNSKIDYVIGAESEGKFFPQSIAHKIGAELVLVEKDSYEYDFSDDAKSVFLGKNLVLVSRVIRSSCQLSNSLRMFQPKKIIAINFLDLSRYGVGMIGMNELFSLVSAKDIGFASINQCPLCAPQEQIKSVLKAVQ